MANFYDRVLRINDWQDEGQGAEVDLDELESLLALFESGLADASFIKDKFGATAGQKTDIQEILDTLPSALLTLVQATTRARWAKNVAEILRTGLRASTGDGYGGTSWGTEAGLRAALGTD